MYQVPNARVDEQFYLIFFRRGICNSPTYHLRPAQEVTLSVNSNPAQEITLSVVPTNSYIYGPSSHYWDPPSRCDQNHHRSTTNSG